MVRISLVVVTAASLMLTPGCLGGSSATPGTSRPVLHSRPAPHQRPYARFQIGGLYASSRQRNHSGRELQRFGFRLGCPAPRNALELRGRPTWERRLCGALLDYSRARTLTPTFPAPCGCPVIAVEVYVAGRIAGHPFDRVFTQCMCGESPRLRHDVETILRQHPRRLVSGA